MNDAMPDCGDGPALVELLDPIHQGRCCDLVIRRGNEPRVVVLPIQAPHAHRGPGESDPFDCTLQDLSQLFAILEQGELDTGRAAIDR